MHSFSIYLIFVSPGSYYSRLIFPIKQIFVMLVFFQHIIVIFSDFLHSDNKKRPANDGALVSVLIIVGGSL